MSVPVSVSVSVQGADLAFGPHDESHHHADHERHTRREAAHEHRVHAALPPRLDREERLPAARSTRQHTTDSARGNQARSGVRASRGEGGGEGRAQAGGRASREHLGGAEQEEHEGRERAGDGEEDVGVEDDACGEMRTCAGTGTPRPTQSKMTPAHTTTTPRAHRARGSSRRVAAACYRVLRADRRIVTSGGDEGAPLNTT